MPTSKEKTRQLLR